MPNLVRNGFLLARTEGANYGVDAIAAQAAGSRPANAIRVVSMDVNPITGDRVQRQNLQGFLGARKSMLAREHVAVTITLELGGSGTAGTAPRFAPLLTSCGLAETTSAAVTGSSTAGGSNTITLAAGASAVNNFYLGQVVRLTSGANTGQVGVITSYDGTTKVATVAPGPGPFVAAASVGYSIEANAMYTPISQIDGVSNTSSTIYCVKDQNLHVLTGFRGSLQLSGDLNNYPTATITGVARYNTPITSSGVTATFAAQAEPDMFEADAVGPAFVMGFGQACWSQFQFDLGNSTVYRNLVNCTQQALITDRTMTGLVTIENPNVTTYDFFTRAADNSGASDGATLLQQGTVNGRRVVMYMPRSGINGDLAFSEMDGVEMLQVPLIFYPSSSGNDEARLTFC